MFWNKKSQEDIDQENKRLREQEEAQRKLEAEKRAKEEFDRKIENIILTTCDLKQDYEIIGLVEGHGSYTDDTYIKDLKLNAAKLGADAVIGIRKIIRDYTNPHLYGTAVKIK